MARKKSEFLSSLGVMFEIWKSLTEAVLELGGTDDDMRRIGTDPMLRAQLAQIIVKSGQVTDLAFPIWKPIKLGTGLKTADDFRRALKQAKMEIGRWSNDLLGKSAFTVSETEMDVDLVVVSVKKLGFKQGAYRRDIVVKALELGFQLCFAEVGPQLRLQYPDQPRNERLIIGMEPIVDSDGYLRIFSIGRDSSEHWLDSIIGNPADLFWSASHRFVFIRPRKFSKRG